MDTRLPYKADEEQAPLLGKDLSVLDRLRYFIKSKRLTRWYVSWCIFNALLCIGLILYALAARKGRLDHYPRNGWFLTAEALITLFISFETVSDMIVYGCEDYWQDPWHVFDFLVCILCLVGLVIDYIHWYFYMQIDDYISVGLLIVRYIVQSCRVVRVLRQANQAVLDNQVVEETPISLPDCYQQSSS
mmetsp:Transcript_89879/g.141930  ORF Transcript_89879/g.141930 Transcript_89879/m.141930 type:complete len:189 (+) Transcript_89879:78-644(+)